MAIWIASSSSLLFCCSHFAFFPSSYAVNHDPFSVISCGCSSHSSLRRRLHPIPTLVVQVWGGQVSLSENRLHPCSLAHMVHGGPPESLCLLVRAFFVEKEAVQVLPNPHPQKKATCMEPRQYPLRRIVSLIRCWSWQWPWW